MIKFKCPTFNNNSKNHKAYKETGKYSPFKEENKSTETVPEKDLMGHILDKDENNFLKMLKELKEDMNKLKKIMYEQDENVNEDIDNLKRNQK